MINPEGQVILTKIASGPIHIVPFSRLPKNTLENLKNQLSVEFYAPSNIKTFASTNNAEIDTDTELFCDAQGGACM